MPIPDDEQMRRSDGKLAFSVSGSKLAPLRQKSKNSRIKKVLGKYGPFSDEFKEAILEDHNQILERNYLEKELKASKQIHRALAERPNDPDCVSLLNKLKEDPRTRTRECVLCPFWKHEHQILHSLIVNGRYAFPRVTGELYLLTIIFDFAENLFQLEQKIRTAHDQLKSVIKNMSKQRHGVMMVGCLEPDLHSGIELMTEHKLAVMMKDFNLAASPAGGWVLTGHFFVRVPHRDQLEKELKDTFPSRGWNRVQFDSIKGNRSLETTLVKILGYAAKYPKPLFDVPTRGEGRVKADRNTARMQACFHGPSLDTKKLRQSFDISAAIRQWALFVDRMTEEFMYYSVESVHAQKWYSGTELDFLIRHHDYHGWERDPLVEIHRDTGPFTNRKVLKVVRGHTKRLRSRRLQFDEEWMEQTHCGELDPKTDLHDFTRWIRRVV